MEILGLRLPFGAAPKEKQSTVSLCEQRLGARGAQAAASLLSLPHSNNVFYEDWMREAAAHFLSINCATLFAYKNNSPIGLFPIHFRPKAPLLPFSVPMLFHHQHCFSAKPIIRRGFEEDALRAFLRWLDRHCLSPILRIEDLPTEDPVTEQLLNLCQADNREVCVLKKFERAVVRFHDQSPCSSFEETLPRKLRKDLRRKRRRLEELGKISSAHLCAKEDIGEWIHNYHRLELSGWKGRAGTAISQSAAESQFFQLIMTRALEKGQLIALQLCLDGTPIAQRISFSSGDEVFSYKTVYDEEYARCSPGLLLEIENLDFIGRLGNIREIDFCSEPNHPLFDRLTEERKKFSHLLIALRKPFSNTGLKAAALLRKTRGR